MFFRSLGPQGFREWSEPVSLDKKIAMVGLFPRLTPDGKYWICFEGGDYFWFDVSAVMEEIVQRPSFPLRGL
ncbi:MAG: hypothetical protein OEW18_02175 [Candidatus Aminicenantes bacterium]|nr:hypothetical protein [Candidatus Aminicenantes bacterium]